MYLARDFSSSETLPSLFTSAGSYLELFFFDPFGVNVPVAGSNTYPFFCNTSIPVRTRPSAEAAHTANRQANSAEMRRNDFMKGTRCGTVDAIVADRPGGPQRGNGRVRK